MGYAMKWRPITVKSVDLKARKLVGLASTDAVDYDGEVVLPSAWKESLRAWKKLGSRPKFLAAHKHSLDSGHSPALGTIDSMEIVEHGLVFEATFADTELGNEYLKLYDMKAMDAFSIGFLPREREFDAAKIRKILDKEGIKEPEGMPCNFITTKAHAMEVSCVVLGTNYEALVKSTDPNVLAVVKSLEGMGIKFDEKGCAHGECPGGDACVKCAEKRLEKFDFNAPDDVVISGGIVRVDATDEKGTESITASTVPAGIEEKPGMGWDEPKDGEYIHYRIRDPGDFKDGTLRTVTLKKDKPRILSVMGKLKSGESGMVKQNLLFPKDEWSLAEAKKYLGDHPDMKKMLDWVDLEEKELSEQIKALASQQIEIKSALERIEAAMKGSRSETVPERRAVSDPPAKALTEADYLMRGLKDVADQINQASKKAAGR